VFVPLDCFAAFQAEIMIFHGKILRNRTGFACAPEIFRNTEHAFAIKAVEFFVLLAGAPVVGRAAGARTDGHFIMKYRLSLVSI
jgi:hypothetical protein